MPGTPATKRPSAPCTSSTLTTRPTQPADIRRGVRAAGCRIRCGLGAARPRPAAGINARRNVMRGAGFWATCTARPLGAAGEGAGLAALCVASSHGAGADHRAAGGPTTVVRLPLNLSGARRILTAFSILVCGDVPPIAGAVCLDYDSGSRTKVDLSVLLLAARTTPKPG